MFDYGLHSKRHSFGRFTKGLLIKPFPAGRICPAHWKRPQVGFFFHRLAIMGLTEEGMQPFELDGSAVVCNGELYGFRSVKEELRRKGYTFKKVIPTAKFYPPTKKRAPRCSKSSTPSSP